MYYILYVINYVNYYLRGGGGYMQRNEKISTDYATIQSSYVNTNYRTPYTTII